MHRFPGKSTLCHFLGFHCFSGKDPLNKNRKHDPPAFLGVLTFGTISNAMQCTVFPEKGALFNFLAFLFFKEQGSINTRLAGGALDAPLFSRRDIS